MSKLIKGDLLMDDRWQDLAACRGMDTNLFFPEKGESPKVAEAAKAVCARCPVTEQCFYESCAPEVDKRSGIWGGLNPRERQVRRVRERLLERELRLAQSVQS